MPTTLELPTLDGHDALGFLATLGLHRLLDRELDEEVRLSFSPATGRALLHSSLPTIDTAVEVLAAIIDRAGDDTAIVDINDRFPFQPKDPYLTGSGLVHGQTDPMRAHRQDYPLLVDKTTQLDGNALPWLRALVTDLAVDNKGRVALTPFCAPSGQQKLRTFFSQPLQAVRAEPHRLAEALTGWQRVENFTGEYLDHRVTQDAANHPEGQSADRGVPGATWLATQALPLFRLTGDGQRPHSTLWHPHNKRRIMLWPLWQRPLNLAGVRALLDHPHLKPSPARTPHPTVNLVPLHTLSVFSTAGAERRQLPGRQNAGILVPLIVTA